SCERSTIRHGRVTATFRASKASPYQRGARQIAHSVGVGDRTLRRLTNFGKRSETGSKLRGRGNHEPRHFVIGGWLTPSHQRWIYPLVDDLEEARSQRSARFDMKPPPR